ncbi:hypothetical protein WJU16_03130 [Chitinophaga pollutisoli]|uniref:Uncharacterized protein n=1 Tax=Chitinophaga pollutisoli TaxID=3133966 RepID=A0ABZ2YRD6_9BACT
MTKITPYALIAFGVLLTFSCKDDDRSFTSYKVRNEIIQNLDTVLGEKARFTLIEIERSKENQYTYSVYGYKINDHTTFYGLSFRSGKWDTIGIYSVTYRSPTFSLAEINYLKYMPEYVRKNEKQLEFGPDWQFQKANKLTIKSNDETHLNKVSIRYYWNQSEGGNVSILYNEDDQFKDP